MLPTIVKKLVPLPSKGKEEEDWQYYIEEEKNPKFGIFYYDLKVKIVTTS